MGRKSITHCFYLLKILSISLCFPLFNLSASDSLTDALDQGIINHRNLSTRCQILNQKREQVANHRQYAQSLKSRSDRLGQLTPQDDLSSHRQLSALGQQISNELLLINEKLINREEEIIRAGCPRILF